MMHDLRRLYRLFRPSRGRLLAGILLSSVVILANAGLLALAGWFIAAMALSGVDGPLLNYFVPAAGIRGLAIVRTGGRYGERLLTHDTTLRLLATLRGWFYTELEPLAPARLQHYRGGDLLSRIRADIDSLDNFYLRVLVPSCAAILCAMIIICGLALFSVRVALIDGGGLLVVGLALPWGTLNLARGASGEVVMLRAVLRAETADYVRGLGELQIYQAADRIALRISNAGQALVRAQRRLAWINACVAGLTSLVMFGTMGLALLAVLAFAVHGAIDAPDVPLLILLVLGSFEAVVAMPPAFQALAETLAAIRRIFEIIDIEPSVVEPTDPAPAPRRYDVAFKHVRMRYHDDADWALDDVSLTIHAGQRVALVGVSGVGKTSLFNILLRFYPYQEGDVMIGDVSVADCSSEVVRGLCAVVAQQTHLFNASIRQNLLLAKPDASDAALWDALAAVDLSELVRNLPRGLDSMIGEANENLSGGEARRIAIARAMLKDAPILLLDEPTEGLDNEAEARVLTALDRLMRGRTTIMISHHPSCLRYVDRVVTLARGRMADDRRVGAALNS